MKLYVAGPMSGIPKFNFPAFFEAADQLNALGIAVVNPAEIDHNEDKGLAMKSTDGLIANSGHKKTWGDFLMRDVKIVADEVDGVCVLPNWFTSRGARLETFVALGCQKPVFYLNTNGQLEELDGAYAMTLIAENTIDQGDVSRYSPATFTQE